MRMEINRKSKYHLLMPYLIFSMLVFTICLVQSRPAFALEAKPYKDYIAEHDKASRNNDAIDLKAVQFSQETGASRFNGNLLAKNDSKVTYNVTVPKDGLYYIGLTYKPVAGGSEIIRKLYINDEVPFKEAQYISLKRYYRDKDQEYKNQKGNQTFPAQVEVEVWKNTLLSSADGYIIEPLAFYFKAGENTLTFEAVESDIWMDTISLIPAEPLKDYKTYIEDCRANGYQVYDGTPIKVQAEDAAVKSAPNLYPINDRSTPKVEPYDPSYIVLNAIGGYAWRIPGQMIEWEVDAPKAGLYKLALKYKQNTTRGTFSTRNLAINGEVPFAEARDLRFNFNSKFSLSYLADRTTGEDYYFYLNKGKNTISMEVSLGVFGELTSRVQDSMKNLNSIYQDVIVITSTTPDKNRDYNLLVLIPDLKTRLEAEKEKLQGIVNDISKISGSFTQSTTTLNMMIVTIDKMLDNPNKMAVYLNDFKTNMSALGDWMIATQEQPLELDYFILAPDKYTLPKAEGNFFDSIVHDIRSFIGSFFVQFNGSSVKAADKKAKTIDVWVTSGRDQFNVLTRMVNESFGKNKNFNVNLRLVGADTVFPATLTGNGPDVNIQVAASTPINFGYRGAAYDLTKFPDFNEVAARFSPAAVGTFNFNGAVYAIPDQMSFNVMFYRTDIFNELGLEAPKNLHDFLAIVPILQKKNMDIYFSTGAQTVLGAAASSGYTTNPNPVYLSFLYQNGGKLYSDNGKRGDITSDVGIKTFKYWTELYTKHNFLKQADFVTRFRMGEIPVGIVDFTTFNALSVAAPEIKGDWAMAQIPGTVQTDGSVKYDTPVTASGSLIVKNIAEKKGTLNESWEFLKWWTSAETQYEYATEMESVLGLAGRYAVANLEAFNKIAWGKDNMDVLQSSLPWIRTVPQVPGSYLTGRVIDNAFNAVINENKNPTDEMYKALDQLNQEIINKRKEFHID